MEKQPFSIKDRIRSFRYAGQGFISLISSEHNSWIHLFIAGCVIGAGFIWEISITEWCLIVLCIGGVLAAEGFNSAIEALSDKVSRDRDPLIGKAKDIAAFSVLIMCLASICVGLLIFFPKWIGK